MEIKFWDAENNEYITNENGSSDYYIDENSTVFRDRGLCDWEMDIELNIEAHFYLNGERIA